MRRSTVADVTRDLRRRRPSAIGQRPNNVRKQSVGSAGKAMEKPKPVSKPRSQPNLLSMAVKEEVHRRVGVIYLVLHLENYLAYKGVCFGCHSHFGCRDN